MKERLEEFKELWSDKKKRAAILLIMWLVFILLVTSFIKIASNNKQEDTKEPIGYIEYDNYEFTITTSDLKLTGAHYADKSLFTSDDSKYYIESDKLYSVDGSNLKLITDIKGHQIVKLQPKYLGDLINNATYEYSVTDENKVEKKTYNISSTQYYKLYNQDAPKKEFIIPIYVYITNGYVSKIEFSDITITYSNIGKVSKITLTNN